MCDELIIMMLKSVCRKKNVKLVQNKQYQNQQKQTKRHQN